MMMVQLFWWSCSKSERVADVSKTFLYKQTHQNHGVFYTSLHFLYKLMARSYILYTSQRYNWVFFIQPQERKGEIYTSWRPYWGFFYTSRRVRWWFLYKLMRERVIFYTSREWLLWKMRKRKRGHIYNKVYRGKYGGRKWIQGDDVGFVVLICVRRNDEVHRKDVDSL